MRENMGLYRGKRTDNGEWAKGFYVHLYDHKGNESHRIYPGYAETDCGDYYPDWFEVDPETVGQYSGLDDMNEQGIFEGDIVQHMVNGKLLRGKVDYADGSFGVRIITGGAQFLCFFVDDTCEVIGNIHDNPELLEVK